MLYKDGILVVREYELNGEGQLPHSFHLLAQAKYAVVYTGDGFRFIKNRYCDTWLGIPQNVMDNIMKCIDFDHRENFSE